MSRFRRAAHSIASGYAVLVANGVYSLISWPLAMHYLSNERFGLWGLMGSIAAYLSLVDLGMSGSVARLLIDHKDDPARGSYGSLIKTGWLVLTVQGAMILLAGWLLAPLFSILLKIEPDLQAEFIGLMRWQTTALALSFVLRIFSQILQAHQRIDIVNYSQISTLLLNLTLLWFFLHAGHGVFSLVWAALLSACLGALMLLGACWHLKHFPPVGCWGRPSWSLFHDLFGYGKDLFLISLGGQLIVASQSMIITARIGLIAAGAWYAGTRAFNLISQAIWRISDVSAPVVSEMIVRREQGLLRERYRTIAMLTASFSGFAAVSYALCNSLFVTVIANWTRHPIEWRPLNDILLALWMIPSAIQRCHNIFIMQTKQIGFARYIFFVEGIIYVSAAFLSARLGGLPAIIGCSIACSILFSGAYGVWRISRYFEIPVWDVVLNWQTPMLRTLLAFAPVAALVWYFTTGIQPLPRLIIHALVCGSAGFYLFLRLGLLSSLQKELLGRAPRLLNPVLRWAFGAAD